MNSQIAEFVRLLNSRFVGFEEKNLDFELDDSELFQPVFIVGAPRSGTTILWQSLIYSLELGYISNAGALLLNKIISITHIQKKLNKLKLKKIKNSSYGFIKGIFEPNEASKMCEFYYEEYNPKNSNNIRKTINLLSKIFNANTIIKNTSNSFRIENINRIHLNPYLIHITRKKEDNYNSLSRARRKLYKNDSKTTLGYIPSELTEKFNSLNFKDQIEFQIELYNSKIREHKVNYCVKYEEFRKYPDEIINEIAKSMSGVHRNKSVKSFIR